MRLVLLGPPGAGKGTQGDLLAERCGIPRYATGDILREAVSEGRPLGREARGFMDRGELVPDKVVLGLIRDVLKSEAARRGFVLDGFPRTVRQAEGLDTLLEERNSRLDAVIYFDVPEEELVRRLGGRRVCSACGTVFNVNADPRALAGICDSCGGKLEIRDDDKPETIRNRLRVYREKTEPLLDWYRRSASVSLHQLAAVGSVEEVQRRLLGAMGCS